jgi:hypothetical protein
MEPTPQARPLRAARAPARAQHLREPAQRSRVTNGKSVFVTRKLSGPWARRFRDVLAEIINDLGGFDLLSEGQKQLARRATTISIACEQLEGACAQGSDIDLEVYGKLSDRLGRCFGRLGLERRSRDVTPTLSEYLQSNQPASRSDGGVE